MSYSLNEIEALCKRAARGAGLSWGLSEEAGKAARWLACHDLDGPGLLAQVLTQNDGVSHRQVAPDALAGTWSATAGPLCPLAAGAALNDCADRLCEGQSVQMENVSFPLLVVPFAAWAAIHIGRPVRVTWQDVEIDTDGYGLRVTAPQDQITAKTAADLTCTQSPMREAASNQPGTRGAVTPEIWARLNAFAQRTYAPATEASRLLGAGAGVSDND